MELVLGRFLYITESGANSVIVYDLDLKRILKRIPVGFHPRRILQTKNFVYVANYNGNSVSAIRQGSLATPQTISVSGAPLELAYANRFNWVYVGNPNTMSLEILDSLTHEVKGNIELGAVPGGMVVIKD